MKRGLFAFVVLCVVLEGASLAFRYNTAMLSLDIAKETGVVRAQIQDMRGRPLSRTRENNWNFQETVPLHEIPVILLQAFVFGEDKRFFEHDGIDWVARAEALLQNIRAGRAVRGASTITEQVTKMLVPRRRTFLSRIEEGFEAQNLERRYRKGEILEFYLNQVPYAGNRRGVLAAARDYFDRDLRSLSIKEMLALVVLVRAPSRLDLRRDTLAVEKGVRILAGRMYGEGMLNKVQSEAALQSGIKLRQPALPVIASDFVRYVSSKVALREITPGGSRKVVTTLDGSLQNRVQQILDVRLNDLAAQNANDGAVLVVENDTGTVRVWVNAQRIESGSPVESFDSVLVPRQPGSTLKPFLYALAMEKGWTAASIMDDSPITQGVSFGIHEYRNYSRVYYGPVRLREALGNSLNTPAIRAVRFVGVDKFLDRLRQLGFRSLENPPVFYGDGLALGNGEVSLFELVQGYSALACGGVYKQLRVDLEEKSGRQDRIFSPEVSSIIADILSDPESRSREFGREGVLSFPVQTAVKTGTSSDYKDAWAIGFSDRYTVGVWLGNLTREPMREVSGARGPGLVLRAVFNELQRFQDTKALYVSPRLERTEICRESGKLPGSRCPRTVEWFQAGSAPSEVCHEHDRNPVHEVKVPVFSSPFELSMPTPGLHLAMDPRIPDELEAFAFELPREMLPEKVEWDIDGQQISREGSRGIRCLWPLARGNHIVEARVWFSGEEQPLESKSVAFVVK